MHSMDHPNFEMEFNKYLMGFAAATHKHVTDICSDDEEFYALFSDTDKNENGLCGMTIPVSSVLAS